MRQEEKVFATAAAAEQFLTRRGFTDATGMLWYHRGQERATLVPRGLRGELQFVVRYPREAGER